jgi:hypothetical protein
MAEQPQCAKHTLRTDFCVDCTFFCGDTPLFAPAKAGAQNARDIAMLAHQIDQPHNPPGRVVVVIPRMCAFSRTETSKNNRKPLDYFLLGTSGAILPALASEDLQARGLVVIFLLKVAALGISGTFAVMDFSAGGH